ALAMLESGPAAVVPGQRGRSELWRRVTAADAAQRMPPPETGKPLSSQQVELLGQWIDAQAPWQGHWSLQTPTRPQPPDVDAVRHVRNPIDRFVLSRLAEEDLSPAEEAAPEALLRRVTLDLTGLPPTLDEIDAFLADESPDAYERVVDRLLASPRYGERMALSWLDAARFADTNGYNNDEDRTMWPWRDWVIQSFNANQPYDQFVTEQLAGDLLPGASLPQRIASGFNRNHVLTTEGGIIEEEYRVEYVADRVHTTSTVFMGLSMQCARCHDHKYDPITQADYHRLFAYFNQLPDRTVGYNTRGAAEPFVAAPTRDQQAALDALRNRQRELASAVAALAEQADSLAAAWEQGLTADDRRKMAAADLWLHFPLDEALGDEVADTVDAAHRGKLHGNVRWNAGHSGKALELDGTTFVDLGQFAAFERDQTVTLAAWVFPTRAEASAVFSKMDDANAYRGFDLLIEGGKPAVHMVHHWSDNGLKVIARQPMPLNAWHHLAVTYDGSSKGAGVSIYVDGQRQESDIAHDTLTATIATDQPLRIGRRSASCQFHGRIDDARFFRSRLSDEDVRQLFAGESPDGVAAILEIPSENRDDAQRSRLRQYYLQAVDSEHRQLIAQQAAAAGQLASLEQTLPIAMIMQDQPTPRTTYLLQRGQYDQRGAEVAPGTPGSLPPLTEGSPANRLGLAQWLVDPDHPLTARVAVNRWWRLYFGEGLVETEEDFGAQGAWPTHPELLDWLATELVASGWNVKQMQRLMVTSATYRQSSDVSPELLERDPHNKLLARGARFRLSAETIRDSALAAAGLFIDKLGGPSVKPYQPDGLWEDVSVERRFKYVADPGEGLYRRSMYTFWKRTCPPPGMTAFDAPDRESCQVRRARTNTPLQALVLLNDPTYVEAARKLAERMLRDGGDRDAARLAHGFRLAMSRVPRAEEAVVLLDIQQRSLARFQADPALALQLLAVGQSPRNEQLDANELAAWTTVASMLLNLDEAITKN
ncbi:MAG: DUF1553 domain-containing protein, partial [Pirellulales bacterium]